MTNDQLVAPFVYFGGKRHVAAEAWRRFGKPNRYVEPFFGSGAVLLGRPDWQEGERLMEVANDLNGYISNFWRSIRLNHVDVAAAAKYPLTEHDLVARNNWLVEHGDMTSKLMADLEWCDPEIAGIWVWVVNAWIGKGAVYKAVERKLPDMSSNRGILSTRDADAWIASLAKRLRWVKVACGDWTRVVTPAVLGREIAAIFLDPPYDRYESYYPKKNEVSVKVREWAIEHGDRPHMRIALCGYDDEHTMPDGWKQWRWTAQGGYSKSGNENRFRECVWFSPYCQDAADRLPGLGNTELAMDADSIAILRQRKRSKRSV